MSVNLPLLSAGILMSLGFIAHEIAPKRPVAWALAAYLALWGIAWVAQLALLKRAARDYGLLPQWALFFACAGLAAWGALAV